MPDGSENTDATATDMDATGAEQTVDHAAEAAKWKALARKHEEQSKANADKAKRYDELEEAAKTDLEKAIARAEAAEKAIAEREAADTARSLREAVADERGIAAGVLRGSTREELEAHADELTAAFKVEKPKAPSADGQGDAGGDVHDAGERSADDIVAAATGR